MPPGFGEGALGVTQTTCAEPRARGCRDDEDAPRHRSSGLTPAGDRGAARALLPGKSTDVPKPGSGPLPPGLGSRGHRRSWTSAQAARALFSNGPGTPAPVWGSPLLGAAQAPGGSCGRVGRGQLYEAAEGGGRPVLPSTCPAGPEGLLRMEPGALSLHGRAQPGTSAHWGEGGRVPSTTELTVSRREHPGLGAAACFKRVRRTSTDQEGLRSPLSGRRAEEVALRSGRDRRRLTWGLALSSGGRPVWSGGGIPRPAAPVSSCVPRLAGSPTPRGACRRRAARIWEQGLFSCERDPGEPLPLPPARTRQEVGSCQNRAHRPLRRRPVSRLCGSLFTGPSRRQSRRGWRHSRGDGKPGEGASTEGGWAAPLGVRHGAAVPGAQGRSPRSGCAGRLCGLLGAVVLKLPKAWPTAERGKTCE